MIHKTSYWTVFWIINIWGVGCWVAHLVCWFWGWLSWIESNLCQCWLWDKYWLCITQGIYGRDSVGRNSNVHRLSGLCWLSKYLWLALCAEGMIGSPPLPLCTCAACGCGVTGSRWLVLEENHELSSHSQAINSGVYEHVFTVHSKLDITNLSGIGDAKKFSLGGKNVCTFSITQSSVLRLWARHTSRSQPRYAVPPQFPWRTHEDDLL